MHCASLLPKANKRIINILTIIMIMLFQVNFSPPQTTTKNKVRQQSAPKNNPGSS